MKKVIVLLVVILILFTSCASNKGAEYGEEILDICFISTVDADDGGFFQDCKNGVEKFASKHSDGCKVTYVVENDFSKIVPTVQEMVDKHDVFVLPGYTFAEIGEIVLKNPDKYFIVIDAEVVDGEGKTVTANNLCTFQYREEESGFFAGIVAALESKTLKVAVVNACPHASNVDYQYGFVAGVNYANAHYGTKVQCIELPSYSATDDSGKNIGGNYIGSYVDREKGKKLGNDLIDAGADVLFIAAGDAGNGALEAIKEAKDVWFIGSDTDQYDYGKTEDGNVTLTSAYKVMGQNIYRQLNNIIYGTFEGYNAVLDSGTDSTCFIKEEGRYGMQASTLEKLETVYALVKNGAIVPPSVENGFLTDNYPGK